MSGIWALLSAFHAGGVDRSSHAYPIVRPGRIGRARYRRHTLEKGGLFSIDPYRDRMHLRHRYSSAIEIIQ